MSNEYSDWSTAKGVQCGQCLDYCVVKREKICIPENEDDSVTTIEYWCRRIGCNAEWEVDPHEDNSLGVPL